MAKPLGYYVSGDSIYDIAAEYGDCLQDLSYIEQLALVSIISQFLNVVADDAADYDLLTTAEDNPLELSDDVTAILENLQESISESLLKGFLLALSSYIHESGALIEPSHPALAS